jgi:LysM repeat protein
MKTKKILCLALVLSGVLFGCLSASAALEELLVQPGDTLSQIAERHSLSTMVLQNLNHIQNPNAIQSGRKLLIPNVEWLVEPFLKNGEKTASGNTRIGYLSKTNLLIGLDVWTTNSARFLAIRLEETNRMLFFDSGKLSYDKPNQSGSSWSFIDLDGDGDSDILCDHEEGSARILTLYAFHFDGQKYHQYLLADEIAIGFIEPRKKKNRSAVINIYERYTGRLTTVDWEQIKNTRTLENKP